MVPVQTIFALLALLVMMSSCSQEAPPHPGKTTAQSQSEDKNNVPNRPDQPINIQGSTGDTGGTGSIGGTGNTGPVNPSATPAIYTESETFVNTTETNAESGKLMVWGPDASDAEKLYRLLAVNPAPMPNAHQPSSLLKQGSQFTCERSRAGYSCTFIINYADGSVTELLPRDQVSYFDSDIAQVAGQTNYLRIADPAAAGKKVRLFVRTIQAQTIYDALQVSEIQRIPDARYSAGTQKDGANVRCLKQTQASDGVVLYSCYLYLDVSVGSIDKPTVGSL
jgi:hypothetical protein